MPWFVAHETEEMKTVSCATNQGEKFLSLPLPLLQPYRSLTGKFPRLRPSEKNKNKQKLSCGTIYVFLISGFKINTLLLSCLIKINIL
jgi:hypothetical protein